MIALFQLIISSNMVANVKPFIIGIMVSLGLASRFAIRRSKTGMRCIVSNDTYYISETEEYHHCVIRCMHKGCLFFNYNVVEHNCQLSDGNCLLLILDSKYNLRIISIAPCLQRELACIDVLSWRLHGSFIAPFPIFSLRYLDWRLLMF